MTFIVTASGAELSVRYPRPEHITAATIAHSLAQVNRFTGHCMRPYSVAEHSLLVCEIVEREFGLDVHGRLAALMHDAHEAFCGDMHSPGKAEIGQPWHDWEQRWLLTVRTGFALHTASDKHAAAIRQADLMALATERRDLLPPSPSPWGYELQGIQPIGWVNLRSNERWDMSWHDWRQRWLDEYESLDYARNEALFGHRN